MLIKISLKFVLKGPIDNNPALVEIMAWRRIGDKPLSEPMLIRFTDVHSGEMSWSAWIDNDHNGGIRLKPQFFCVASIGLIIVSVGTRSTMKAPCSWRWVQRTSGYPTLVYETGFKTRTALYSVRALDNFAKKIRSRIKFTQALPESENESTHVILSILSCFPLWSIRDIEGFMAHDDTSFHDAYVRHSASRLLHYITANTYRAHKFAQ